MMPRTRADAMAIASLAVVLAAVISAKVMQALPAAPADEPTETSVTVIERNEAPVTVTAALSPAIVPAETAADQVARSASDRPGIFARYQQSLIRPAHDRVVMQYMPPLLRAVLNRAAAHFAAPVLVTSAYRSPAYNRQVRGAWRSMHMVRDGKRGAVDFKVVGVSKGTLYAWAKRQPEVSGIGLYCRSDFIHVDNGNKRSWYWGCGGGRRYAKGSKRIQVAGAVAGSHDSH
jgi:peptidase M15-like protein